MWIGTLVVFCVDAAAGEKKELTAEQAPFLSQLEDIESTLNEAQESVSVPASIESSRERVGERVQPQIQSYETSLHGNPGLPSFGDLGNAHDVIGTLGSLSAPAPRPRDDLSPFDSGSTRAQFGRRDDFTVPGSRGQGHQTEDQRESLSNAPPSNDDPTQKAKFFSELEVLFTRLAGKSIEELSIDDYYRLRDKAHRSETWFSAFLLANAGTKTKATEAFSKFAERDAEREAKENLRRIVTGDTFEELQSPREAKEAASKSPRLSAPQTH